MFVFYHPQWRKEHENCSVSCYEHCCTGKALWRSLTFAKNMPSTSTVVPHSTAMSVVEKSMSKKVGMTAQGQWAHHTTGNDRSVRLSSVL